MVGAAGRPPGSKQTPQTLLRRSMGDAARIAATTRKMIAEGLAAVTAATSAGNPVPTDRIALCNELLPIMSAMDKTVADTGKLLTGKGVVPDETNAATPESVVMELTKGKSA